MDILAILAIGGSVTLVTQLLKKLFAINGLAVAAGISLLCGLGYASLTTLGYWDSIKTFVMVAYPVSVTIYQVITQAVKAFQDMQS